MFPHKVIKNAPSIPLSRGLFGIQIKEAFDIEVSTCKILFLGDPRVGKEQLLYTLMEAISKPFVSLPLPPSITVPYFVGDQKIDVIFWLRSQGEDIEFRQKMFEHVDVVSMIYSAQEESTFSNLLIKWYPQASQFSPEAPIFLVGNSATANLQKVVSEAQTQYFSQTTRAQGVFDVISDNAESVVSTFDILIRETILERLKKNLNNPNYKPTKKKTLIPIRKNFNLQQRINNINAKPLELPPLPYSYVVNGAPELLEEMSKIHNIKLVEGTKEPALLIACQRNPTLARKLLEFEGGIANFNELNLEKLPDEVFNWIEAGTLKELNISKNMFQTLPIELRHIKKVSTNSNPLQTIPADIREAKWPKIKKYLEGIAARSQCWDIRKLVLLGEEGVGKSTLLRCLESKTGRVDTTHNLATDGVDIKDVKIKGDKEQEITFNCWDLGGQIVFYPTHQFFITKGAIYVIVFNFENIQYARIEYWMKQIKILCQDSALIIMVGTHCENMQPDHITSTSHSIRNRFPKHKFPNFQNQILPVSAKSGIGIRELKKALVQLANECTIQLTVPVSWVQLYETIKVKLNIAGTDYVEWPIYLSWCNRCGILNDPEVQLATKHLTNTGALIHYHNDEDLKDLVIINPQWLSNIMSGLITFKVNFVVNGFIESKNFQNIYSKYNEVLLKTIVHLLQKFKIIFPMQEGIKFLVPSLLPSARPASELMKIFPEKLPHNKLSLGRVFRFGQLPIELFSRLMVAILYLPNVEGVIYWRNGLLFNVSESIGKGAGTNKCLSLIEYEIDNYQLSIQLRYESSFMNEAVKCWRKVLETVKGLIDSFFPQITAVMDELIPCTHCLRKGYYREKVYLFDYKDCDQLSIAGENFIYCNKIQSPSRCVLLSQLAPDIHLIDLNRLQESNLVIDKQLGEGAFGTVFKATLFGKPVAVKQLHTTDKTADLKTVSRFQEFQTEAYLMSLLDHPCIVKFYGVMLHPPRMVLQYVDGCDLFQFLHPLDPVTNTPISISQESISWQRRYKIAYHIASGIHYLQSITPPVVHRDLRSPNIFVTKNDHALIGDFGLARLVQGELCGVLGTWQWLAPEIIDNRSECYDERTDIYSFGVILYELSSFLLPFDEFSNNEQYVKEGIFQGMKLKSAIIYENLRPTIPEHTPAAFSALIRSCWSGNPDLRPTTQQILQTLASLITDEEFLKKNHTLSAITDNPASTITFPAVEDVIPSNIAETVQLAPICSYIYPADNPEKICASHMVNDRIWLGFSKGSVSILQFNPTTSHIDPVFTFQPHTKKINAFLDIYDSIWISSEDGNISVVDAQTFKVVSKLAPFGDASPDSIACVSNDQFVTVWVGSSFEGKITIWNGNSHRLEQSITHEELIGLHCIEQVGDTIWAATKSSIIIYSIFTFDFLGSFNAHDTRITNIKLVDSLIWTTSYTNIRVWSAPSVSDLRCVTSLLGHASKTESILLTHSKSKILTGSFEGSIVLWDVNTFQPLQELVVTCDDSGYKGIRHLCEDSYLRLWTVSAYQICIWPDSEDLHPSDATSVADMRTSKSPKITRAPLTHKMELPISSMDPSPSPPLLSPISHDYGNAHSNKPIPPPRKPTSNEPEPGTHLSVSKPLPPAPSRKSAAIDPLNESHAPQKPLPAVPPRKLSNDSSPLSLAPQKPVPPIPTGDMDKRPGGESQISPKYNMGRISSPTEPVPTKTSSTPHNSTPRDPAPQRKQGSEPNLMMKPKLVASISETNDHLKASFQEPQRAGMTRVHTPTTIMSSEEISRKKPPPGRASNTPNQQQKWKAIAAPSTAPKEDSPLSAMRSPEAVRKKPLSKSIEGVSSPHSPAQGQQRPPRNPQGGGPPPKQGLGARPSQGLIHVQYENNTPVSFPMEIPFSRLLELAIPTFRLPNITRDQEIQISCTRGANDQIVINVKTSTQNNVNQ